MHAFNGAIYWEQVQVIYLSVFEAFFMSFWCTELCAEETLRQMCWGFKGIAKTFVFMYQR